MKIYKLAIASLLVISACGEQVENKTNGERVVRVKTTNVESATLTQGQNYSATIEEQGGTTLSFASMGTISSIYVSVGQTVNKGQLIGEIDPVSAQNAYEAAKATKEQALDAQDRMKQLYEAGSLSEIKWIEVQTQVKQAVSAEQIARKGLTDTKLYAPSAGYVSQKFAEAGQNAAPGVPIVKIVKIDRVKVKISVPESEISTIQKGQSVTISVPALGGKSFSGKISEKGIAADELSRSYAVKAEIENPRHELLPGMICNAAFSDNVSDSKSAITLSADIVQIDSDNKPFVWLVKNGTAQKAYITLGENVGDRVVVNQGLTNGDKIIVEGQQKVSNGMKISE